MSANEAVKKAKKESFLRKTYVIFHSFSDYYYINNYPIENENTGETTVNCFKDGEECEW